MDGKQHGIGKIINKEGIEKTGEFANGKFIQWLK